MVTSLALALLMAAHEGAADGTKPAAVQVCFAGEVPLFSERPQRNYRKLSEDAWLLDLDVTVDGSAPERITRASASCVRLWVEARPVQKIALRFDRTDTNLAPVTLEVSLKLKPDLFYEAGTVILKRGKWARVHSRLPGSVALLRVEEGEWTRGEHAVEQLERVPQGQYKVRYTPPSAQEARCPVTVEADARGTIRADTRPRQLQDLLDSYRAEVVPDLLQNLKVSCAPSQELVLRVTLVDGMFRDPWKPEITKVTRRALEPKLVLRVDGERRAYQEGDALAIGFGQTVELDEEAKGSAALAQSSVPST